MKAEGKSSDAKRPLSTSIKISKSSDETPTQPAATHSNGSKRRRPTSNGTTSKKSGRRQNSAMTAVFWILLAFGFFQILLYHPDIVKDDHWFDHQIWKLTSHNQTRTRSTSMTTSRASTEAQQQQRQPPPATPMKQAAPDKDIRGDLHPLKGDPIGLSMRRKEDLPNKEGLKSIEMPKQQSVIMEVNGSSPLDQESSKSNTTSFDNPIMQVLVAAGLKNIDPKDLEGLPSPDTLTMLYGSLKEPVVVGMETCAAYRDKVPPNDRIAAVAGMFNTGTNAMAFHLRKNINIKNTWQIPWGKHRMEFVRMNHTAEGLNHVNKEHVLPIVLIRDPFYWMQSMCKSPYAALWPSRPGHCPNLVPDEADRLRFQTFLNDTTPDSFQVKIVFDKTQVFYWKSLAHLWSHWYRLYLDAEYPRLMFRFEDLLFHGPFIMKRIAECAGVTVPETFQFQTGSAKGHGSHATFLDAIIKTGDLKKRLKNFTPQDLEYASQHLDPDLMRVFRYALPDVSSVFQER